MIVLQGDPALELAHISFRAATARQGCLVDLDELSTTLAVGDDAGTAAAQWTTSAVGDDLGQKGVPFAQRWGERMRSD